MLLVLGRMVKGQPLAVLACMSNIASVVDTHSMFLMLHSQMYQRHRSVQAVHRFPDRLLLRSGPSMLLLAFACARLLYALVFVARAF